MTQPSVVLALARNCIGAFGLFIGFFFWFSHNQVFSISVVSCCCVVIVGLIASTSHILFAKSDAARLGWESDHPYWQYEVGFSNLAIAVTTLLAVIGNFGVRTISLLILCYALYLLQAGLLHGTLSIRNNEEKRRKNAILTLVYSIVMMYFGLSGIMMI